MDFLQAQTSFIRGFCALMLLIAPSFGYAQINIPLGTAAPEIDPLSLIEQEVGAVPASKIREGKRFAVYQGCEYQGEAKKPLFSAFIARGWGALKCRANGWTYEYIGHFTDGSLNGFGVVRTTGSGGGVYIGYAQWQSGVPVAGMHWIQGKDASSASQYFAKFSQAEYAQIGDPYYVSPAAALIIKSADGTVEERSTSGFGSFSGAVIKTPDGARREIRCKSEPAPSWSDCTNLAVNVYEKGLITHTYSVYFLGVSSIQTLGRYIFGAVPENQLPVEPIVAINTGGSSYTDGFGGPRQIVKYGWEQQTRYVDGQDYKSHRYWQSAIDGKGYVAFMFTPELPLLAACPASSRLRTQFGEFIAFGLPPQEFKPGQCQSATGTSFTAYSVDGLMRLKKMGSGRYELMRVASEGRDGDPVDQDSMSAWQITGPLENADEPVLIRQHYMDVKPVSDGPRRLQVVQRQEPYRIATFSDGHMNGQGRCQPLEWLSHGAFPYKSVDGPLQPCTFANGERIDSDFRRGLADAKNAMDAAKRAEAAQEREYQLALERKKRDREEAAREAQEQYQRNVARSMQDLKDHFQKSADNYSRVQDQANELIREGARADRMRREAERNESDARAKRDRQIAEDVRRGNEESSAESSREERAAASQDFTSSRETRGASESASAAEESKARYSNDRKSDVNNNLDLVIDQKCSLFDGKPVYSVTFRNIGGIKMLLNIKVIYPNGRNSLSESFSIVGGGSNKNQWFQTEATECGSLRFEGYTRWEQ